ncbi:helix-turn-helix domain-containing protein [Nocardioides jishulii]|nr:helix-turn-helix transcriptional regulator [Nocardioides jishulii]
MTDQPKSAGSVDRFDAQVGKNLEKLRKARDLTQTDLAARVAERGVPFRQQTVVKIEKGQRSLKLREVKAVANALEVGVETLVAEESVMDWSAVLMRHTGDVEAAWEVLHEAALSLIRKKMALQFTLDGIERTEVHVEDSLLNDAATLLQVDPVKVVQGALGEIEAERRTDKALIERSVDYVIHNADADPTDG